MEEKQEQQEEEEEEREEGVGEERTGGRGGRMLQKSFCALAQLLHSHIGEPPG